MTSTATPSSATRGFGRDALQQVVLHLFADMQEAVIIANARREMIMVNDTAAALFRYSREELLGRETVCLYENPEDFHDQGRKRFNDQAGDTHDRYLMRYRRQDGSVFVGETIGGAIRGGAGEETLFLGIIRDISARLASDEVLERLYDITSTPDLTFVERRQAILELGCRYFGMPLGIVSRVTDNDYEIIAVHDDSGQTQPGLHFPLAETYCYHTLCEDGPFGVDHVGDSDICDHPCYQRFQLESYIGAPLVVKGQVIGTINFSSALPTGEFSKHELKLVGMFAQWLSHEIDREQTYQALRDAHDHLNRLATHDELTGLANRRLLAQRLDLELDRCQRYARPLTVALVDFDHFKQLNDTYGHAAGDKALQLFATVARETLRTTDLVGRWGGEEFLILLPETPAAAAATTLERLADRVRSSSFVVAGKQVTLTVSIGAACESNAPIADSLVTQADQALYRAKANGRDRVVLMDE